MSTKISALPAASAADGSEVAPVVQSSTTKKMTISQIQTYIASLRWTQVNVSSNVSLTANAIHFVDTSSARTLTFPSPAFPSEIIVVDSTYQSQTNNITFAQFAAEKILNRAASLIVSVNGGVWHFFTNGTDWFGE